MSAFTDDFAAAGTPQVLQLFGTAGVVYTAADGSSAVLTVAWSPVASEYAENATGQSVRRVRSATFTTDVAGTYGGVARPAIGSTLYDGTTTWTIENVSISGSLATAKCVGQWQRATFQTPSRR